jgi:uncharacterized membrane protein YdjX (TVP38/TMEM64 family)
MKRYTVMVSAILAYFLISFLVVEVIDVPLLKDPSPWFGRESTLTALLGSGLLVADVILPVPSSAVMVAHGALFGAVGGTLLSVGGSMGAALDTLLVAAGGRYWHDSCRPRSVPEPITSSVAGARWP